MVIGLPPDKGERVRYVSDLLVVFSEMKGRLLEWIHVIGSVGWTGRPGAA